SGDGGKPPHFRGSSAEYRMPCVISRSGRKRRVTMESSRLIGIGAIVGVYAVLLAPADATAAGASGSRPVIEVREKLRDGGLVEEGTVVPARFEVENRGLADLELTQVKPSCGCTVVTWDRVVKPGGRGIISVEMNTQYFRGSVTKH